VLFGGCALSSKALEVLPELGLKLASQYGQTELSGMVLLGVSVASLLLLYMDSLMN
jgi:long-subunit acyl-CoA synthetase (AMP-forming)